MGAPITQVNSQSQSGAASFGDPWRPFDDTNAASDNGGKKIKQIAKAQAKVKKKVKVDVEALKKSNAQGQGQITQADFIFQIPIAENEVSDDD